jgi:peptide/nickel transport system permease protein
MTTFTESVDTGLATPTRRTLSRWFTGSIARLVLRRACLLVPQLFVVSALSFFLTALTPGNAAQTILGINATRQNVEQLDRAFGLNLPIWTQYWHWLQYAVIGNLGNSFSTGQPVTSIIGQRLPVTLSLIGGALVVSIVVGVGFGLISALRGGIIGRVVDSIAMIGFALPSFWVGAELIVLFAVKLQWLPATGYVSLGLSPARWLESLALPVAALSLASVAAVAKQTREAVLETVGMEYVRMAWASGLSQRSIIFRHTLKNASTRIITVLGVQAVGMLVGTIFIENVFALPGLGSAISNAALTHDLPLVQGIALVFTIIVAIINLAVDLTYAWLNPKVKVH